MFLYYIIYYILYYIYYVTICFTIIYFIYTFFFRQIFQRREPGTRKDGMESVLCHGFSYKKKEKTAKLRDEFYFGPPAATPLKYNSLKSRKRGDSSSQGSRLKTSLNVPFFSL